MRSAISFSLALSMAFAFGVLTLNADDAKPPVNAKDEAKPFQGSWKVAGLEADGRKAPAEAIVGMKWSFKGLTINAKDPGDSPTNVGTIKLDTSKTPHQIDIVGTEGPGKGKTMQGIYKFEKNQLIICLRDEEAAKKSRPTEFATEANSGLGMITLERAKE